MCPVGLFCDCCRMSLLSFAELSERSQKNAIDICVITFLKVLISNFPYKHLSKPWKNLAIITFGFNLFSCVQDFPLNGPKIKGGKG